jgi:hypothetical protein
MPLQATSGAASYDAFGGGVAIVPNYIEDVFSTWLYTGNGSTQTITNGIDLAGEGGLVWVKSRSNAYDHQLYDTGRGANYPLASNNFDAQYFWSPGLSSFNSNGFSINSGLGINGSGSTFVSWTFRKQPKFFDVVTYTGNSGTQNIPHNLGSLPGCIITKRVDAASDWSVWHRTQANAGFLNLTNSFASAARISAVSSTNFTLNTSATDANSSGFSYVAYIFAHDAGGFGLTGTDNVISCGSYTGTGTSGLPVTLGYEPQWLLVKRATGGTANWYLMDNMRGLTVSGSVQALYPNLSSEEFTSQLCGPTATGFQVLNTSPVINNSGDTYIYIAIRRGPMKVPTTGTSVFAPLALNNTTGAVNTTGFPVDMQMQTYRAGGLPLGTQVIDRLRGISTDANASGVRLITTNTNAETGSAIGTNFSNTGFSTGAGWNNSSVAYWNLRRAPGFFDEVCYTGTGSARSINHNLTVAPELLIFKNRTSAVQWKVWNNSLTPGFSLTLNTTAAQANDTTVSGWNATTFSLIAGNFGAYNQIDNNYVTYLFASCPGVSKVGSFTGTGATQVINCGFTGGARFVLIKATSTTGDWYVWDSARGIVAGNDPYLLLNSTAAEVTTTDWVDTAATGFELSNAGGNLANSSGVSYIFLAIA